MWLTELEKILPAGAAHPRGTTAENARGTAPDPGLRPARWRAQDGAVSFPTKWATMPAASASQSVGIGTRTELIWRRFFAGVE